MLRTVATAATDAAKVGRSRLGRRQASSSLAWTNEGAHWTARQAEQEQPIDRDSRRAKLSSTHVQSRPTAFIKDDFFDAQRYKESNTTNLWQDSRSSKRHSPPKNVVEAFRDAIQSREAGEVAVCYERLRTSYVAHAQEGKASTSQLGTALSSLTLKDMRAAMQIVLGRDQAEAQVQPAYSDARLVTQIFADLSKVFRMRPDRTTIHYKLSAEALLMGHPDWPKLVRLFKKVEGKYPTWRPAADDWLLVAQIAERASALAGIEEAWHAVVQLGSKGSSVTIEHKLRDLVVHNMLKLGARSKAIDIITDKSGQVSFWPLPSQGISSLTVLLQALCRVGLHATEEAGRTAEEIKNRLPLLRGECNRGAWHALFMYEAFEKGPEAAVTSARAAIEKQDFKADASTFYSLVECHQQKLEDLAETGTEQDVLELFNSIRNAIHVDPEADSFTLGILALLGEYAISYERQSKNDLEDTGSPLNSIREMLPAEKHPRPLHTPGQVHEATLLYRGYKASGKAPSYSMLQPLLTANMLSLVPSPEGIAELYRDFRAPKTLKAVSVEQQKVEKVYAQVLAYTIRNRDYPSAKAKVQDILDDGIVVSAKARAGIVLALLQEGFDAQEAFALYSILRDTPTARGMPPFPSKEWLDIIVGFSMLHPQAPSGSAPSVAHSFLMPQDYMLQIIDDARGYNIGPDARLFTTLLSYCGRSYTTHRLSGTSNSLLLQYRRGVMGLHQLLLCNFDPFSDMFLLSALINAYNHVQLPDAALEMWNNAVAKDVRIDSAVLAATLDTCGHAGMLHEARLAWTWARRDEHLLSDGTADEGTKMQRNAQVCWPINKGVWDAYIECLARCHALREAISLATTQMSPDLVKYAEYRKRIDGKNTINSGDVNNTRDVTGPDEKTFGMLLQFTAPDGTSLEATQETWQELRKIIRLRFPHVWPKVEHIRARSSTRDMLSLRKSESNHIARQTTQFCTLH